MTRLDDIDLLDLDRWARDGAPYEWFSWLREDAPVWRHPSGPSGGFWVISRYEDVVALGRCPHILSSDVARGGVSGLGPGDELQDAQDQMDALTGGAMASGEAAMLLTLDPPEHTSYRKIVNKGFTPRMIGLLEERIRGIVNSCLDGQDSGAGFDLVTELAMPLPIQVISEMIGAPREMHGQLARLSNEAVAGTDPEYRNTGSPMSELAAIAQLIQLFDEIENQHRSSEGQGQDLTSALLSTEVGGEPLSQARLKMFMLLLTVAGNETTRNAIGNGAMNLAANAEQWQRLRDDPSLIPKAVEEILRYASPVLYFRRNVVDDMEVRGVTIPKGEIVSLWYASANRDGALFPDPDTFDVGREPNHHVAFGGGGPHFCLGASLARLEIRVVLEVLVERYRAVEVTGPPERLRSNFLHGIKHLPVRLVAE